MRRLIIAPHMDDESLGCGGLLAKHSAECSVVVVTDSGRERASEHQRALDLLGIEDRHELGMRDGLMPLAEGPQGCSSILPTWVALSA